MAAAAGARMLATKMGVSLVARPASFPSREVFNLYRQMSSVSKPPVEKLAEELLEAIKEPAIEGSTDKLIKKAEDLLKALKVAPKAEGHEITCTVSKLTSLESGLSDVKATAMLTGSVSFTIFGIIGCVLLSFPKDIQDVRVKGDNNAKLLENNDKKYKKLKRRVVALEKTAGTAEGKTDGPASGPAEAKTTGPAEAKTTGPASGPAEGKRGGWLWPW